MGRPPKPPREFKPCAKCGVNKHRSEYYRIKWTEARTKYLPALCAECNKEDVRIRSLYRLYGLSDEEYLVLLGSQHGVCATCFGVNPDGKRLAVDHDHETGKIRGLLCSGCNLALGSVKDNTETLERMLRYLCAE